MKKHILLLILLLSIVGCINLKSPYPMITYHRLQHEPFAVQTFDKINATVQMRKLSINDEFDTDHFLALKDGGDVQVYFYNRWIANFSDLVTGYMLNRINGYGVFSGGFLPSSSMSLPEYIVEGRILSVLANNSDKRATDANWVEITANFSLIKRDENNAEIRQLFNKNYTQRINRRNNSAESIRTSMSKAVAFVSDMLLVDIHNAIKNDIEESSQGNAR